MPMEKAFPTLTAAIEDYLQFMTLTRSANTVLTYRKALKEFKKLLVNVNGDPENSATTDITEDILPQFILHLNETSPATQQLYTGVVARFLKYLVGKELCNLNIPRMELLLKQHTRTAVIRLPLVHTSDVEHVLDFISNVGFLPKGYKTERLRALRDRAFLLTLADA